MVDTHVQGKYSAVQSRIAGVRFQKLGKLYHFDCSEYDALNVGDYVIVETIRGRQMGQVMGFVEPDKTTDRDVRPILRVASPRDLMMKQTWESRQLEALITTREKAQQIGGFEDCKFLEAQYNYDGTSLTILFSASDNKVNTNRLRSALGGIYKSKIELRQVGPRDEAKLIGGAGACGITRCCSTFLTEFSPISIKMAKAQGISLNPSEITGMCGRLRCCLVYEYEQYVQARKELPKRNKVVGTPQGEGKVIDIHPLQDAVTVLIEEAYVLVKREDLIPLEELAALDKKAKGGCAKHDGGGCDCHSHGPKDLVQDDSEESSDFDD
jgi:cell fate regulator YaaT (PSP1 superfamily)